MEATGSAEAPSARMLAAELGGLPLALAQAAAYCRATGRTLAGYLRLLRKHQAEVLARGAPAAHVPAVATWSLAMAELEVTCPGAVAVLRLAAFLAPEDIPFRLLLRPGAAPPEEGMDQAVAAAVDAVCVSELAVDDAVSALRRQSLISGTGDVFGVHRLVQAVTRGEMPAEVRAGWRRAAAALVEAAVPQDADVRASWEACRLLLPHAQAIADPLGMPMWRLPIFLGSSGDYANARAQWHSLADAHATTLGPEHPNTLATRANHARWTGAAGDAVAARDLFAALLPVRERVLGSEHPYTLATRDNHARWTGEAGDAAAARDLYTVLLPVREKVLGPEHPNTLATRANHARWTGQAGDAVAARDLFAALLPVREWS